MIRTIRDIVGASLAVTLVVLGFLSVFEAQTTDAASTEDQFLVTQSVTAEIAFSTGASDVTMSPSLGGLTGGTSTAETHVNVLTNALAGYTMTIKSSSSPAMQHIATSTSITDYTSSITGVPDFTYRSGSTGSGYQFAYSISASSTPDLAQKFRDDGSNCNTGTSDTNASTTCWYGFSTTATSTIVRSIYTPASGATTTIYLRLTINPNSAPIEGTYHATTTFTATTN